MNLVMSLRVPSNDPLGGPKHKQMLLDALDRWQEESEQAASTSSSAPAPASFSSAEGLPQQQHPTTPPSTQGVLPLRVCAPPEEAVEMTVEAVVLYSVPLNDRGVTVYADVCGQQSEWTSTSVLLTGGGTAQCNLQEAKGQVSAR